MYEDPYIYDPLAFLDSIKDAPSEFYTPEEEKFEIQLPEKIEVKQVKMYTPFKSFEQLEKDVKEINKQINK